MTTLFYFTRAPIGLEEVARIAQQQGCLCWQEIGDEGQSCLRVFWHGTGMPPGRRFEGTTWCEGSACYEDRLSSFNGPLLAAYRPRAGFCIVCPDCSGTGPDVGLPRLTRLLSDLLERHSGWVACEDDWAETFDARSIAQLACGEGTEDAVAPAVTM
jgi:hypothetical protein